MHSRKSTVVLIATLMALFATLAGSAWAANDERVLYSFSGGADGGQPLCALIFDAHGNLYGTTHDGGAFGDGTVFELTPAANGLWSEWKETVLHSFHKDGKDGAHPFAGVIFDKAGNLWGTTEEGGAVVDPHFANGGTVFELSPGPNGTWSETVISFPHAQIYSGLICDKAGNIYGTTRSDPRNMGTGGGTVFKLGRASNGKYSLTTLYGFKKAPYKFMTNTPDIDGIMPVASVIFDAVGNLYGTTSMSGISPDSNSGTVFKLTRGSNGVWAETILRNSGSRSALTMDSHGNLCGIGIGGAYSGGIIFEPDSRPERQVGGDGPPRLQP